MTNLKDIEKEFDERIEKLLGLPTDEEIKADAKQMKIVEQADPDMKITANKKTNEKS